MKRTQISIMLLVSTLVINCAKKSSGQSMLRNQEKGSQLLISQKEEKLDKKSKHNKNPVKVNKSVSINIIKNKVIDLFYNDALSIDEVSAEMDILF